jgi:cytochrome c-type biogenesis protein CcmH
MKLIHCMWFGIVFFLLQFNATWAAEALPLEKNASVEIQVQRLSEELRCLVCQNQTLADSHAELAQDLKQEIREMATKGISDQDIIDFLVVRYGDFVRYRPVFKTSTALLWIGPFVLLLGGMTALVVMLRRRQNLSADDSLSPDALQRINTWLDINKES